jgi:hypothetical protein
MNSLGRFGSSIDENLQDRFLRLPHVRLTVSGAMGLVMALAVGLAALRNANELWAGSVSLLSWALLGVALLGVIQARDRVRARWLGYLVLGGGYSALAFGPWSSERVGPSLVTTRLMGLVNMLVTSSPVPRSVKVQELLDLRERYAFGLQATSRVARLPGDPAIVKARQRLASVDGQIAAIQGVPLPGPSTGGSAGNSPPPNRWKALLPGAANYDQFLLVGHSLCSLLAGAVGSVISAHFHSGRGSPAGPETGTPGV